MDRIVQNRIGQALRRMYENVSTEAIPDRFRPLLQQLERCLSDVTKLDDTREDLRRAQR